MGQLIIYQQRLILNSLKDTSAIAVLVEDYNWDKKSINDLVKNLDFVQNTLKDKDEIFGKRWLFNDVEYHYYNINSTESFKDHKESLNKYFTKYDEELALKFNIPLYKAYLYDEKKGLTFFGESYGNNPIPVNTTVSP